MRPQNVCYLSTMHETKSHRWLWLCAVAAGCWLIGAANCPVTGTPVADKTEVNGSPFGADFSGSHATHKVVPEGAIQSTVVRIAPRPDVCEALLDPTDNVDPSLVIVIKGTQVQETPYQVVGLDYVPPAGGGGEPVATVTLVRFTSACDGGSEDAGIACAASSSATGGKVTLQKLVEGELAAGIFAFEIPGGGSVDGMFFAPACPTIR
jgi:hypothetical protein